MKKWALRKETVSEFQKLAKALGAELKPLLRILFPSTSPKATKPCLATMKKAWRNLVGRTTRIRDGPPFLFTRGM
jgi:hypothetical protein